MKIKIALLTILTVLFAVQKSEAKEVIKGNKKVVTREIEIADYERIEMVGQMELIYEPSNAAPYFEITVDENILPWLKIEVEKNCLVVETKSERRQSVEIHPTTYKIRTNSKKLVQASFVGSGKFMLNNIKNASSLDVSLTGSGKVLVDGWQGDKARMDVTGSGSIDTQNLFVNQVRGMMTGSGKIKMNGEASTGNLELAGSGKIQAENCLFKEVKAEVSGSGGIAISVTDHLTGEITGSGSISYKGNPSVYTNTVGSGKVKRIN